MATETISKYIAADAINETHLDLGSGSNQIDADTFGDGSTNAIVTLEQESNWDNHVGNTSNPHSVTASQAGAIADGADQVDDTHIDWGTGEGQVSAVDLPIADAGSFYTGEEVETALQEIAGQLIAMFTYVFTFEADGGYDDVDAEIDIAATVNTPRTNFIAGKGVFIDATADYSNGAALPANGTQVTELGLPGCVFIRDNLTKDIIDDGSGNEVYGVLFYDTSDSKYYLKYFSDQSDVQTAYSGFSTQDVDFYFAEIFTLKGLDPTAIIKGGIRGGTDMASAASASSTSLTDSGGNYTATDVEGALAEQMNILSKATISSRDVTAGFKSFATKARGAAGEKTFVSLIPKGGPFQEYGVDFTAMNNDSNDAMLVIWKTSGAVTDIASPVYPSAGLSSKIAENDVIMVQYNK